MLTPLSSSACSSRVSTSSTGSPLAFGITMSAPGSIWASTASGDVGFEETLVVSSQNSAIEERHEANDGAMSAHRTITWRIATPSCSRSKPSFTSSRLNVPVIRRSTGNLPRRYSSM